MSKILLSFLVGLALPIGGFYALQTNQAEAPVEALSGFSDPFVSIQLATSPSNGDCLTTDGTDNAWGDCGTGTGSATSDWQQTNGALTPTTTIGIRVNASSTIGDGTGSGGLTVLGNATTSGNLIVQGTGTSTFAGGIQMQHPYFLMTHGIAGDASDGLYINSNNGTPVGSFGVGNTANSLFYGGVNIDGATRLATSITGVLQAISGAVTATSTISEGYIPSTIARDTELHDAVTLAGENYLSLSTQQITANAINADNLSATDFGSFTCNGTTCTVDTSVINEPMLDINTATAGYMMQASSTATGGFAWVATSTLGITATGDGVSNWLYQGGRLSPSTTVGIGVFASSTIGNGTGAGGLTISGDATTTGNHNGTRFLGNGATDSVSAPSFSFKDDPDTGMFLSSANTIGLGSGNATIFTASGGGTMQMQGNTDVSSGVAGGWFLNSTAGTPSAPVFTFPTDTNTGIYSSSADILNFSVAGSDVMIASTTGVSVIGTATTTNAVITGLTSKGCIGTNSIGQVITGTCGTGTVTSVDMSVPTGLSISGNPITTSGTLALALTAGYAIPTTTRMNTWDTAYGWGNHAVAGYDQVTTAGAGLTRTVNDFDCDTASATVLGCLTSGDWNIFNNKLASTSIDTSAELATILTDETGTAGSLVFSGAPTFTGVTTLADYLATNGTTTNATSTSLFSTAIKGTTIEARTLIATSSPSFNIASTTKDALGGSFNTATATLILRNSPQAFTLSGWYCKATTTGSVSVRFGDGTNWTNDARCSTGGFTSATSNNTFTQYEDFQVQIGSGVTNPSRVTVTPVLISN